MWGTFRLGVDDKGGRITDVTGWLIEKTTSRKTIAGKKLGNSISELIESKSRNSQYGN